MNKFKQTQLGQEQMLDFAKRAIEVRFGEESKNIQINYEELITPTRVEDRGSDLWSVFNVVQEKIIHGMFEYSIGTKNRKARKIKNFKQDITLNAKLYELANEYVMN
jgi:IS1 family transposase